MGMATQIDHKFFGLVELDAAGKVLYSRVEREGAVAGSPSPDMTGRNFYTEVAPFKNVGEFQHRLDSFSRSSQQADSIHFTCDYEDGPLAVKILLARIRERSEREVTKSILVHIRKV
jgi:methyl-accepting chemotaxis protein